MYLALGIATRNGRGGNSTAADRGTTETTAVHGQLPEPRPAFGGMAGAILQGSQPDAVIFAHDAERASRYHWDHLPLADLEAEIRMAEALGGAPVAAITTRGRDNVCRLRRLGLPVADVLDGDGAAVLPDAAEAVWSAPQGAGRAGAAR
nr:NAD-dependent epimerase/dehydratase family protein [Streptomyces sp. NBC_01001]